MLRLGILIRTLVLGTLCVLAVAACGSQQKPAATTTTAGKPQRHDNHTVWIYSSLPQGGPDRSEAMQIRDGIRLALAPVEDRTYHGFRVRYRALNDSAKVIHHHHGGTVSPGTSGKISSSVTTTSVGNTNGPNPTATVNAAETAARNPETIAYIGDLNSSATALSLPILNQAGILQITPGSGYPGLTDSYKPSIITQPSEPAKYYPQPQRTLLRLIPSDIVQASAALEWLRGAGCQSVAAWDLDTRQSQYSAALLGALMETAPKYGMKYYKTVVPAPGAKKTAGAPSSYYNYIHSLQPDALHCGVLVGHVSPAAVAFTVELRVLTGIPVLGTDGFCNSGWVRGIPKLVSRADAKSVVAGLYCTTPALPVSQYQDHRAFSTRFRRAYHRPPDAYDFYGYHAAEMVLKALKDVGSGADNRKLIVQDLFAFDPSAALPFTFDPHGNVETNGLGPIAGYGVDVFTNGAPTFRKTVNPVNLLSSGG